MDAFSLYIHVPFCRAKCAYCDFDSYPGLDHLFEKYVRALQREMRWLSRGRSLKVKTIYLGGGTPTVLPLAFLGEVLDACYEHFTIAEEGPAQQVGGRGGCPPNVSSSLSRCGTFALRAEPFDFAQDRPQDEAHRSSPQEGKSRVEGVPLKLPRLRYASPEAEITVEANPGTVDGGYLAGLLEMGVNRLSLGVQSFHDNELRLLGRIHTAAQAVETYRLAREMGFGNVNLDLICGLPRQALSSWQATLRQAIHLRPGHLSLYCLTVEEGTPLGQRIAQGELPAPDPDLAAEMYMLAEETLDRACYAHYEISNWAQPGYECRHNLTYWRNRSYLGLGAGAHSYFGKKRWHNVWSPAEYITRLEADWQGPFPPTVEEVEEIDETLEMAETMILGLRLVQEGVRLADFRERFGRELMDVYG
ncbi:MAG: radical SAM family heme chaperone HemW, partial [Anaerolineae bacterium]